MTHTLALIGVPDGLMEMVVVAIIGLLLFGKRLPEVGRSVGRSIVEFKKGLKGVDDDIENNSAPAPTANRIAPPPAAPQIAATPPAAKFDPYTGKPIEAKFDPFTGKPIEAGEPTATQQV